MWTVVRAHLVLAAPEPPSSLLFLYPVPLRFLSTVGETGAGVGSGMTGE